MDRDLERDCDLVVARIALAARKGVRVALLSFSKADGVDSFFDIVEVWWSPRAEKPG